MTMPNLQAVEVTEAVEVIEGTSLPLLDHLDDLDTIDYLELEQPLVIDQGVPPIYHVPHVLKARTRIKVSGASVAVIRVETHGVGRPGTGDPDDLVDAAAAHAPSLIIRTHRHVGEVEGAIARSEVGPVDRPRLSRGERKCGYGGAPAPHEPDSRDAHVVLRATLARLARPMPASKPRREISRRRRAQGDDFLHVPRRRFAKAQARAGSQSAAGIPLHRGTSSVVVARDFAPPRSRAYFKEPGVWYFSRYARDTASLSRSLLVSTALTGISRPSTATMPLGSS